MKRAANTKKVLAVIGPTAVGKSALAVRLARRFSAIGGPTSGWNGAEVISADSRQVYKGLNIGTGKITKKEMRGVPHHLLDVADPKRHFNVVRYVAQARRAIAAIARRNHVPIVCGGTGFYIDALLDDRVFPEVPPNYALRKKLEKKSTHELFSLLKKFDSRRAKTVDPQNPRRLIRAIEIARELGKVPDLQPTTNPPNFVKTKFSRADNRQRQPYKTLFIGLTLPREELKKKIAIRLFARLQTPKRSDGGQTRMRGGMVAEARRLHRQGLSWKRMKELGLEYRYLAHYLQNKITKQEMIEKLKTEIWRYSKRQMTWFRRNKNIKWFNPNETKKINKEVKCFLQSPP